MLNQYIIEIFFSQTDAPCSVTVLKKYAIFALLWL